MSKLTPIRQFQHDVRIWNNHNFPTKAPHQPLLGVVEEACGELQVLPGYETDAIQDAIGDACIYLADYCNQVGIDLEDAIMAFVPSPWDSQPTTPVFQGLAVYCGQLCHAHLKLEQKIRGNEHHVQNKVKAVGGIIWHMSRWRDVGWLKIATEVFAEVSKRDWIKYPETGFPVPEPANEPEDREPGFMAGAADMVPQPTTDQGTIE